MSEDLNYVHVEVKIDERDVEIAALKQALASITRERNEAREENERLQEGHLVKALRGAIDHCGAVTRERDAMREGLRQTVFTINLLLSRHADGNVSDWQPASALADEMAALVNGGGGE